MHHVPGSAATGTVASPPVSTARYVGATACKNCHTAEYDLWIGSDHQLAMQEANAQSVLGNFDGRPARARE